MRVDEVVTLQRLRRGLTRRIVTGLVRRFDRLLLRQQLRELGACSFIDRPRWIVGGDGIAIGDNVTIASSAILEVLRVFPDRPTLSIGDGTVIRPWAHIGAVSSIRLGRRVGLSPGVLITDHEHDFRDPAQSILTNKRVLATPVVIGDDVYLGEHAVVLRGVTIGACSIIGANSVVKDDVPPYSIAVGAPATVVRRWDPEQRAWVKPRVDLAHAAAA